MKTAVIVGCQGQDGTYLFEYLKSKRYGVIGLGRTSVRTNLKKKIAPVDILKPSDVLAFIKTHRPDEVYYLAAVHHSSQEEQEDDEALFKRSFRVHVHGLIHFLDAINLHAKKTRLFYAASSHIFGSPKGKVQDETTPLVPECIYGITKTAGVEVCQYYRRELKLFVSVGILYNHESPLRAEKFVSQKIVQAALAIKEGRRQELVLGDLNARTDWGFAGDYVEAMQKIIRLPKPDDFIVASGTTHSVREFVETAFGLLKLNWKKYVRQDKSLIQKKTKRHLRGDFTKLRKASGWKPKTNFKKLIAIMLKAGHP